uniref:Acireductone dioxygenase n=1 Tax=Solanum tuberosum TaxID=4113 RepID=M1BBE5_SOLTU
MENYLQALLNFQFRYNPREDIIYVWYMDDSDEDQRLPQHHDPKKFVSLDNLAGKDQAKNYICINYL